jgi:hypothetical protein
MMWMLRANISRGSPRAFEGKGQELKQEDYVSECRDE